MINKDDLLFSRVDDMIFQHEKGGKTVFSSFLDEREQGILTPFLKNRRVVFDFYGGFDESERKLLSVGECDKSDFPITPFTLDYRSEYKLSHRDILGSLMGLGINRGSVGDILCKEGESVVFVTDEIAVYVKENLTKAGRVGISIREGLPKELPAVHDFTEINKTISSERLDCAVSALINSGRSQASELICSGLVALNHREELKPIKKIANGDVISIRGYGKFNIKSIDLKTHKGRIKLIALKYL